MTVSCATWDNQPAFIERVGAGSSEAASSVVRQLGEVLEHYAAPRMDLLVPQINELVADGRLETKLESDTIPVDRETAQTAIDFAFQLPRSMPPPEVTSEPDGEISFDWLGASGKMFSVSINKGGRIAYAGRFGEQSKVHGIEQLSEVCPAEILRGIEKATL